MADTNKNTHDTDYVAYHKVKRIFMPLTEIESENPEHIEMNSMVRILS